MFRDLFHLINVFLNLLVFMTECIRPVTELLLLFIGENDEDKR